MNRDETIALWQRCEDARETAAGEGRSREEAHKAAKAVWNAWAMGLVAKRNILENSRLLTFKKIHENFLVSWKIFDKPEALTFNSAACCDFTEYRFGRRADFRGFIFPGDVWFGRVHERIAGKE